jgi:cytochrome c-type biogenesis protein
VSDLVPQVGLFVAFGAGVVSFFSPCVAPLVPGYLSYISGSSVQQLELGRGSEHRRVLLSSLLFVLGFSLVFVVLGASASLLGGFLQEHRRELNRLAGLVMILMGLFLAGLLRLPQLYQDRRFHLAGRSPGRGGSVILGMAFAFGWTPCIGPILASILFYVGASETATQGALLLLAYSLGMGIPFIFAGLAFSRAVATLSWLKGHYRAINLVSGAILVGMGALFLTDRFFYFSITIQRLYYTLLN